jgi:hypothetical protein
MASRAQRHNQLCEFMLRNITNCRFPKIGEFGDLLHGLQEANPFFQMKTKRYDKKAA